NHLRIRAAHVADERVDRVAGGELQQEKGADHDDQDDRHCLNEPSQQIAQHRCCPTRFGGNYPPPPPPWRGGPSVAQPRTTTSAPLIAFPFVWTLEAVSPLTSPMGRGGCTRGNLMSFHPNRECCWAVHPSSSQVSYADDGFQR